jgi:aminopeptidase N
MYRTVAFCKVPAALAQLRVRLGDRSFFKAWRTAFTRLKGDRGSYRAFVAAMSGAVRSDLTFFFDQWFFQAGQPRLAVSWSSSREDGRERLRLAVEQTQPVGVYDLELPLAAVGVSGTTLRLAPLRIAKKQQELTIDVPERIKAVRVDPEGLFPLVTVRVREKG